MKGWLYTRHEGADSEQSGEGARARLDAFGGISLWIPLDDQQPDRIERAARQDIPLAPFCSRAKWQLAG